MRGRLVLALALAAALAAGAAAQTQAGVNDRAIMAERPAQTLAEYRLFRDDGAREPNARVTPYALNTELYSDGALKFRYVYIPEGRQARYSANDVFAFPVGTVLVKTFAFAEDMRAPGENVRFLETRLLIRRESGWVALPYVWNEAQTEARLSVIGADVPVGFTDEEGQTVALDWAVPNVNQCAGCHAREGGNAVLPLGPSARNLNRDFEYGGLNIGGTGAAPYPGAGRDSNPIILEPGTAPQLQMWRRLGLLDEAPESERPRAPNAYDGADGALEQRARAYLDVNCAHCHNPNGPAHTSGLDLRWSQSDPALWGVFKRPVAAGRGSAGYDFSIEPGHPERSILVYRMQSTDPGVMMPELGRQLVDERGIALMRDWIAEMDRDGAPAN